MISWLSPLPLDLKKGDQSLTNYYDATNKVQNEINKNYTLCEVFSTKI